MVKSGTFQACNQLFRWIEKMQSFPEGSLVFTSLPDMSEVVEYLGPRFEDWEQFFMKDEGLMGCRVMLIMLVNGG